MPDIRVQDEQGTIHVFPDGSTPEMIAQALNVKPPTASVSAAPKFGTLPWLKSALYSAADKYSNLLPAAGAIAGGMIGAGAGTAVAPGPGTAVSAIGGAGMGGLAGEALRRLTRQSLGFDAPQTTGENATGIAKEGAIQGGVQAASEALPFAAPFIKRAALGQYMRALAPTTKITKGIAQDIAPQMIQRGMHGSLEGLESQANQKLAELNPQLNESYADLESQLTPVRSPIRGLLPAAPMDVPLGPAPPPADVAGQLLPAKPMPSARISGGTPPEQLTQQIGSTAATVPARIYRPAYMTSSPETAAELPEVAGPGIMRTRNPEIQNRVLPPPKQAPYTLPQGGKIAGAGDQVIADLEKLKQSYMPEGKIAQPQAVNAIESVQDLVRQYGSDISPNSLRRLRQIFEEVPAQKGAYAGVDLSTNYMLHAEQAGADSIRAILNKAPDIGTLNKEINLWLDVRRVVSESALRRTGQEGGLLKTLTPLGMGAAGAIAGVGHGATVGMEAGAAATLSSLAFQVMRTPSWRTLSAISKNRFADIVARGDVKAATALAARLGIAAPGIMSETGEAAPTPQH